MRYRRMLVLFLLLVGLSSLIGAGGCRSREDDREEALTPTFVFSSPMVAESPLENEDVSTLPVATLPALRLESGKGGAKGMLTGYPREWRGQELRVYFSPFYPGEGDEQGIFVLEPDIHPAAQVTASGDFQLGDIPPGQYIVLIGPEPGQAIPVRESGQMIIFEVQDGITLDMGDIFLSR